MERDLALADLSAAWRNPALTVLHPTLTVLNPDVTVLNPTLTALAGLRPRNLALADLSAALRERSRAFFPADSPSCTREEREVFIHNLLVRIHSIIEILVDRPCAMGVWIPVFR